LLCYNITLGLPPLVFATGDSSLQMATQLMSFLPIAIMFLTMIPDGAEGTVFALITSWLSLASQISLGLGTLLDFSIPNHSNTALREGHFESIVAMTWVTSAVQLLPIFFIYLRFRGVECLPNGRQETRAQFDKDRHCWWGAFTLVAIFISSLSAAVFQAVYFVVRPES
jgi:hypothetical protein